MLPLLLFVAQAAAEPSAPAAPGAPTEADCNARKFETIVLVPARDGGTRPSKITLCGMAGQSDAQWVRTLRDAIDKFAVNERVAPSVKEQAIAALRAEIARINPNSIELVTIPGIKDATIKSSGVLSAPQSPPEYSPLPAIPAPQSSNPSVPQAPIEYTSLPPLPTAPPPPTRVLAGSASLPLLPRPRMSFLCYNPGDIGGETPCTEFTRHTLVTVRAGENLPAGTSLRFVRDGNARGEVKLAELRSGRTMRLPLPAEVCKGVVGGRLQVEIVRSAPKVPVGQVVGSDGPYNLRC